MRSIPRIIVVMLTLCCCVGCDQVSKSAARSLLHSGITESLFADSLRLQLTENPGSFLSLGASLPQQLRFALFTAVVGTMGLKFVMELYQTDQVSADLECPRWIVFACVPLGSYLMSFRFLQVAWRFFRTGELPHHDETRVEGIEVSDVLPEASLAPRPAPPPEAAR